jgi:hypothetical protein
MKKLLEENQFISSTVLQITHAHKNNINHEKISLEIFHVDNTLQENFLSRFSIFKFEGTNGRIDKLYDEK